MIKKILSICIMVILMSSATNMYAQRATDSNAEVVATILNNDVRVYTSENILHIIGLSNEEDYTIYNITGMEVKSGITAGEIDISELTKGIYLIKVAGSTVKFVKK